MGGGIAGVSVGVSEMIIILVMVTFAILPWVLGIWALVTLKRVREGQLSLESKLDALSSRLTRS